MSTNAAAAVQIEGLTIAYQAAGGSTLAVRGLSLRVERGETFGLVGESGCGKSTAALALLGYLAPGAHRIAGAVRLQGEDILQASPERLRALRGPGVAMVHQDPVGALNPVLTLGEQLLETLRCHRPQGYAGMRAELLQMLGRVALPEPASFLARYPHQASGGQLQRIAIAMALLARPRVLVLDEPTTGLDVTVEAEVAQLVADLARDFDMAVIYISHNLGLIRRVCGRIGVMYAGELVEQGLAATVFGAPAHPYTMALLACLPHIAPGQPPARLATIAGRVPKLDKEPDGCSYAPRCAFVRDQVCVHSGAIVMAPVAAEHAARCARLGMLHQAAPDHSAVAVDRTVGALRLSLQSVWKRYATAGGLLARLGRQGALATPAAAEVSFDVRAGEIVALVGESGSGKSTLARLVAGLEQVTSGQVLVDAVDVGGLRPRQRSDQQLAAVQLVFQNPDRTLNPSHRVGRILARALRRGGRIDERSMRDRVSALLSQVQLPPETATQWPHALSGGQRQRVAIARALAGKPQLVLADEPVSALDVSVQGAIINLLLDVRDNTGAAILFISHDLALVHAIADRVVVLRRGKVMEAGSRAAVFAPPYHPYTRTLLAAAGAAKDVSHVLEPAPPGLPPGGCLHVDQCRQRIGPICWQQAPPEREVVPGHRITCHRATAELMDVP